MAEDHWQPARLIPTSGISGADEAERRATSALLAVMGAVREFGLAVVKPLGAPAGQLQTFIEVPFKADQDRSCQPDGLVQTTRAGRTWTALVEVKTGASELERPQVETYLDVARTNAFDAVITISNQLSPAPGVHPVEVDRRKLRRVDLHHLSWAELLTIAVQQRVHRGVSDPDQAWILGELIRYLEHPKSGALDFSDMGPSWVPVREAVAAGTLRANDKGLGHVVSRWEQLLRFAALRLGRELGAEVQVAVSRKEAGDPSLRIAAQTQSLITSGILSGTLRIPDAAAPLDVCADLRAGRVTVSAEVDAPREGRATTRVGWLVRQLKDAPEGLRIDGFASGARSSTSELLRVVRDNPGVLIEDPKRDLRAFRIAATSPLGPKRGAGRGGFIDSVLIAVDGFYAGVLQQVRPWAARAPQLPRGGRSAAEEAGIDVTPPPQDLLEPPVEERASTPELPASDLPSAILDGVDAGIDASAGGDDTSPDVADAPSPGPNAPEPSPSTVDGEDPSVKGVLWPGHAEVAASSEIVSWDDAQDRLESERVGSELASGDDSGGSATAGTHEPSSAPA